MEEMKGLEASVVDDKDVDMKLESDESSDHKTSTGKLLLRWINTNCIL